MEKDVFLVGQSLAIEAKYKNYLDTGLLGWQQDLFLLTKAIYIDGLPAKLWKGDVCTVRFLKEGVAYGFKSEIISVLYSPYPLMFIKYPADIECLNIRVAPRKKLKLRATFSGASRAVIANDAIILDISSGGCALKVGVIEGVELSPEEGYIISFEIMNQELSFECRIRRLDQRGQYAYFLGMEFINISEKNKDLLSSFLNLLNQNDE
jgi:c-di-GMP-binding flagellar brake protein YcgR